MTLGRAPSHMVAVVMVNWRAAAMTLHAVNRVFDQTRPPDHVYIVDNGSDDGSTDVLRQSLASRSDRITVIESDHNLGFGSGCNRGIVPALKAGATHVWLLNNDALPEPDCLAALLRAADAAAQPLGAVGSLLVDPTGQEPPHFGSSMRPMAMSCSPILESRDLNRSFAWCTAASLLVSADGLRTVGAFDEGYFMYWEDADLNMRLRAGGFSLVCAAEARVIHGAGTSSASIPVQRYIWHFDSQRRFVGRYHSRPRAMQTALRVKYLLKAVYDRDLSRLRALLLHA